MGSIVRHIDDMIQEYGSAENYFKSLEPRKEFTRVPMADLIDDRYKKIAGRIFSGQELTINLRERTAILNKWVGKDSCSIPFDFALNLALGGFIGEDSGNLENGDVHYTFRARPKYKQHRT